MSFDHIMMHTKAGASPKLGRLTPAERWAWFGGVLALAGDADVRGTFTIGALLPAEPQDVATRANVPVSLARSTLKKARELGMLDADENGVEWVHDWDVHQPKPKRDTTAAERKRRQRERDSHTTSRRDSHAVTPPEGEVEGEGEETAPSGPTTAGARPRKVGPGLDGGVLR